MAQALTLPGTRAGARVRSRPSSTRAARAKYDSDPTSQAFTGPYMIKSYSAGRSITLVRNPNWNGESTDFRPAYADKIVWKAGADPNVAGAPDARQHRTC